MANEMRDRLVELMKTANVYDGYDCLLCEKPNDYCEYCWTEKLADHLIENGVVVPPCKVGDTVYCIDYILEIVEKCIVYGFYVINEKIQLCVDNGECKFVTTDWHYTKAEAEQKLKEMRGE